MVPRIAATVVVALVASLLLAPGAFANFLTPKSGGSPNADSISTLYKIILYLAIVVFVIVEGALAYSVYKFRAKKSKVAAQIHGNTRLEIGWTVAAAVILVIITVVTFVKLPSIINPPNTSANGLLSATLSRPSPPNGKKVTICVPGPPVHLALRVRRPVREQRVQFEAAVLVHDDVRADEYNRRARDPVNRRHPFVVDPVARRQGRRGARVHDLHVVQVAEECAVSTANAPSSAAVTTRP